MNKFRQLFLLCIAAILCFATLVSAFADGDSLIAENLEISTYRGVAVGGRLSVAEVSASVGADCPLGEEPGRQPESSINRHSSARNRFFTAPAPFV